MNFQYWLVRYVPSVARAEFVNIGVIVGADSDWALRRVDSLARANRLGGDATGAQDFLRVLQRAIDKESNVDPTFDLHVEVDEPSAGWVERLRIRSNNAVQLSAAAPVQAQSAALAADLLFDALVLEPRTHSRSLARRQAITSLRAAYRQTGFITNSQVHTNVQLAWGTNHIQRTKFVFAVGNRNIAQLAQVWSFQRRTVEDLNQEIQAWCYGISHLRSGGGQILNVKRSDVPRLVVPPDVLVGLLYVKPRTQAQKESFASAAELWKELDVHAVPVGQENDLALDARQTLLSRRA